ncbi:hypothetical protein BN938_0566 [Mucinivorans hirudinis]|uniref:Uncharacterized protein n=1 Tax=Mucinivorans hirudinis TaxID=1433126 RepID=A0A060R6H9_9BACT|nr:hypothetical protein BN938_0566 [Mucinivorans hirudinis]
MVSPHKPPLNAYRRYEKGLSDFGGSPRRHRVIYEFRVNNPALCKSKVRWE